MGTGRRPGEGTIETKTYPSLKSDFHSPAPEKTREKKKTDF